MATPPRKLLGAADSPYIVSLMRLIETQSKATIARWCMDYCEANILRHCPGDERPRRALNASRDWFEGRKKLQEVKNIILNECHAAARACGQAAACFHTPTHSKGASTHAVL